MSWEIEGFAPGVLTVNVEVRLTWLEWLKVLFGRKIAVQTEMKIDAPVTKVVARALASVP